MAVEKDKIIYTIDNEKITIPFPIKVGSKIISQTEGSKKREHVVERMLDRYTNDNGQTIENIIFAGSMSYNKGLSWNPDYSLVIGNNYIQLYYESYRQE